MKGWLVPGKQWGPTGHPAYTQGDICGRPSNSAYPPLYPYSE